MAIEPEILDPKLAAALDEVDTVLKKHAIGGCVVLASSTHAAFRNTWPEWSAIQREGEHGLRIKSSSERDGVPHLESSVHLMFSIRDLLIHCVGQYVELGDIISKALAEAGVDLVHRPYGGGEKHHV